MEQILENLLKSQDYNRLAQLLWLPLPKLPRTAFSDAISQSPPLNGITPRDRLGEVLTFHIKAFNSLQNGDFSAAYHSESAALQALLKVSLPESRTEVPLLKRLCRNLYHLALVGGDNLLADCARILPRCFSLTTNDRAALAQSKRWASLCVAILLFKAYFKLGTVRLCMNIVRALDSTVDFPPLEEFPKAEYLAYRYYRARFAINGADFVMAEEWLLPAVQKCPDGCSQRREIMIYFIVVRMIRGMLPSKELLVRNGLWREFGNLAAALKSGDLRSFDRVLMENQQFYIQKELFLLIQLNLRSMILQSLYKKMYTLTTMGPCNASLNYL